MSVKSQARRFEMWHIMLGAFVVVVLGFLFLRSTYQSPVGPSGYFLATQYALSKAEYEKASHFYQKMLGETSNIKDASILGLGLDTAFATGDIKASKDKAKMLLSFDSNNRKARLLEAVSHFKRQDYKKAIASIEPIKADEEDFSYLLVDLISAWGFVGLGEWEKAQHHIDNIENNAYGFYSYLTVGMFYDMQDMSDEAMRVYKKGFPLGAIELMRYGINYVRFLHRQSNINDAKLVLDTIPNDSYVNSYIVAMRHSLQNPAMARQAITPQAALASALLDVAYGLSALLDYIDVAPYLYLSLYLDEDLYDAYILLGFLQEQEGKYERAAQSFMRLPTSNEAHIFSHSLAASAMVENGQEEEALRLLEGLYEGQQDERQQDEGKQADIFLAMRLADMYRLQDRHQKAERLYTELIDGLVYPDKEDWLLYFSRAMVRVGQDDWQGAEQDLKTAKDLSDDHPDILNYLGYSWVDRGIHLAEGLRIIKKAVSMEPNNGYFLDSLGWAYFALGNYDEAVIWLEKASALEPNNDEIIGHLADALYYANRKIEARYFWKHILNLDITEEVRHTTEEKLLQDKPLQNELS